MIVSLVQIIAGRFVYLHDRDVSEIMCTSLSLWACGHLLLVPLEDSIDRIRT